MSWSLPVGKSTSGVSFASFGELLQGVFPDGDREFLVTLPIEKYAVAQFFPCEESDKVEVFPSSKTKSLALARDLLRRYAPGTGGQLYLASEIPCGKGLSSSSADMVATARAIESHLGISIPIDDLCRSLSRIEPTDGVMFSECVIYGHLNGALLGRLGIISKVEILSLDEGGQINTLDVDRQNPYYYYARRKSEALSLLERLRAAFRHNSLTEIGAVSTRSTYINQEVNPKKNLERMYAVCERTGGMGLVTSHSGTCIGILYDKSLPGHAEAISTAADEIRPYGKVDVFSTVQVPIERAEALDWRCFARS